MMYYVNWVLTTAQLELLAVDVSVVDYNYGRSKKKKRHRKGEFDDTKADASAVRKAADEWKSKYGTAKDAGTGISIGDILGGGMKADVGVKVTD